MPNIPAIPIVQRASLYGLNSRLVDFLKWLVLKGAVINSHALAVAVCRKGTTLLQILASLGADIVTGGARALAVAACLNNFEAVSWLLQHGVDIESGIFAQGGEEVSILTAVLTLDDYEITGMPWNWIHWKMQQQKMPTPRMLKYLIDHGAKMGLVPYCTSHFGFLSLVLTSLREPRKLMGTVKVFLSAGLVLSNMCGMGGELLDACLTAAHADDNIEMAQRNKLFEILNRHGVFMGS